MSDEGKRRWQAARYAMTCMCETGLRAASGIFWQRLGLLAAGQADALGQDYFAASRTVIAEYLRHTGRFEEAMEVDAVGCNEPAPPTGFGRALTAQDRASLRDILEG